MEYFLYSYSYYSFCDWSSSISIRLCFKEFSYTVLKLEVDRSTSYTVNNLNQYATISGTTAPTWNTDGGLATYSGNTYTYDALGRLKEVDNSIGKYLFSYDPLGRRIKKVSENPSVYGSVAYRHSLPL